MRRIKNNNSIKDLITCRKYYTCIQRQHDKLCIERGREEKAAGMTKEEHVISKKSILRTSRAQWIFPGFLLVEQRDEQSVMGQSVCLFTSAHQSCSAVHFHSTTTH